MSQPTSVLDIVHFSAHRLLCKLIYLLPKRCSTVQQQPCAQSEHTSSSARSSWPEDSHRYLALAESLLAPDVLTPPGSLFSQPGREPGAPLEDGFGAAAQRYQEAVSSAMGALSLLVPHLNLLDYFPLETGGDDDRSKVGR